MAACVVSDTVHVVWLYEALPARGGNTQQSVHA